MRYLAFAGVSGTYARDTGGWSDIAGGGDDLEEVKTGASEAAYTHARESVRGLNWTIYSWWHVVDLDTQTIIAEGDAFADPKSKEG